MSGANVSQCQRVAGRGPWRTGVPTVALWLACATTAQAAAPDYTGLAGPAVFLWTIGHPVETLKGLAGLRADRKRGPKAVLTEAA